MRWMNIISAMPGRYSVRLGALKIGANHRPVKAISSMPMAGTTTLRVCGTTSL